MNKIKKALLLALSLAMSATMFAACKDKNNGGSTSSSDSSSEVSTPVEDSSVEDSSVEDSSIEDSSVEDSSVEDSSVEDSSVEDSSSEEAPTPDQLAVQINGARTVTEFETIQLTGFVTGSEEELVITWKSSDESIATVDENGLVTTYKAGTVTITASVEGASATHELEVKLTNIEHEIEFDLSEVRIYEGEFEFVEASVTYDGETLDNDEYALEYVWEKVSGDDVVTLEADGAVATFEAIGSGTAVYKVSTIARGYTVEKTIMVTVMENEYSYKFANENISEAGTAYKTTLTLIANATLEIGDVYGVINGEEQVEDVLDVEWSADSDVFSLEGGVITALKAGEGVITGTTTYQDESLTITLTVVVEKDQVALSDTMTIETAGLSTISLPEGIEGEVEKVTLGALVMYDQAEGKGSIDGATVTVDAAGVPCKADDLGEGKTMNIETETTIYSLTIDVYTMIINNAEELDMWQSVAADNSVRAGLCVEEQKQAVLSGYFILGDDIEYNKLWKPLLPYATKTPSLWHVISNANYLNPLKEAYGADKIIEEDWGTGRAAGFKGIFDGKGHYINGLETGDTTYDAFIIVLGYGGIVRNVAFTDAKIGSGCGLVIDRGNGTLENIFVEVAEIASGTEAGKLTNVVGRSGNAQERVTKNIVIDMSKVDTSALEYAYVMDLSSSSASGVYVIGTDMTPSRTDWNDSSSAAAFWHYNPNNNNDVAGVFATAEELLADATHSAIIAEWGDFWTVTDKAVMAKSVADMYGSGIEITNEDTSINAGTSFNVETNLNKAYFSVALKEDVAGITVAGNEISIAEDVEIGTTFTVVATSLLSGETAEVEFSTAAKIVVIDEVLTVETYNNNTITLPEEINGTVSTVTLGSVVVYDASNAIGSIAGNVVTVGSMPVAQSDLGDGIAMVIETDEAKYELSASVYTMIIDNAEELEQFYNVAAANAVDAGLCIEAQRGFVHSGYFVLGADIDYNKVWTHISYSTRWAACYANDAIWTDETKTTLVDGAIVEDWGAGEKGGFRGVFDGKGYAIKGLELKGEYAGFIGTMGVDGVLKNVAFTDLVLGQKTGLVERGGRGGFVENVYVELNSIESGLSQDAPTKIFSQHGHTKLANIVINVTECDFTGIEYVYLANSAYNVSENVYIIDRDYIPETKTAFDEELGIGATGFWHFNYSSDTGASFATVEDLLADETHGAIIAGLGGYWKVEDGKLYFGDAQVVMGLEKEFDLNEYKTDVDNQVILENESFVEGSTWSVSINGGEAVDYTVTEAGKAIITVDPATLESYQAKIVISNEDKVLSFSNVIAVTYISTAEQLQAVGMGENNIVATDNDKNYYALANDITFTHAADYSDVVAAGYHKAGGATYQHLWSFQGVFDGNGFKIDNMRVSDGGIFGYAENATIKNLVLTNVHLIDNVPAEISKQSGGYASILAYTAPDTTFENIEITIASSPASIWTWKRDSLFVCSGSAGATTFRDITVDASYIELKTLLGISHNEGNVYENVLIKAANYCAIGYTADSYGAGGVQNVAAMMTEFPDGVTFERIAHAEIPNQPMNANMAKLSAYDGDVTALGFAEGSNVFEVVNTSLWSDRIVFPADSANYDYVEFDVVLSTDIPTFTAWPSNGTNTQGSFSIYGAQMQTSDSLLRSVEVFDKDGNTFANQYTSGFKANTFYTIRVCFTKNETVKYLHFGTSTLQTYYVSNARWGSFDVRNDVYVCGDGKFLANYTGDVTALGFEEGSVVTQQTISDGWSSRVRVNSSIKYDYVDVEFSFTGDRAVYTLCIWTYGIDSKILSGNYSVSATACTAANGAAERTIQILDANGNAVESMTANTVYTLRVYLNSDVASFAVSTFDTSAESTAILNFGDITYGINA